MAPPRYNFDPYLNTTFREDSPDESLAEPTDDEDLARRGAPSD